MFQIVAVSGFLTIIYTKKRIFVGMTDAVAGQRDGVAGKAGQIAISVADVALKRESSVKADLAAGRQIAPGGVVTAVGQATVGG
jgi:hypothetical protein